MTKPILRLIQILIASVLVYGCSHTSPVAGSKFQGALNEIYKNNPDAIGILVHVEAPRQNISWNGAAGFSDKQKSNPLQPDDPILIASNTKTYIAATTLRLVEQGDLNLNEPISSYLENTRTVQLRQAGYQPNNIPLQSLMNHTSGIYDYNAIEGLFEFIVTNQDHRWTKDEQIHRAMTKGKPYGPAGESFNYADTNYLLLGEIIENTTRMPLHESVRSLLSFAEQALDATWWMIFEQQPQNTNPIAHQYVSSLGLDSLKLHQSFDLYGGGGLAATSRDLGQFTQNLFTGGVFESEETLEIMTTKAEPQQEMQGEYMMGISSIDVNGVRGIGHGGFWGSAANYFPELDASISVIVLERDKRSLRGDVNKVIVELLSSKTHAKND